MPPRSKRSSRAPNLPSELSKALGAVRKKPEDPAVWDRLDELCRDLDRPEEAAALYSEVMESKAPVDVRVAVGLRAADFCEEWFENTEPVLEMLSRVLAMVPNHKLAFERLTVLLTVAGRFADLLSAYDSALAASQSDAEKAQLLEEAAKVARDFAGDSELGSTYMKALLLLRPADDQLATVLEKRLDEQGRHQDLIDVWTARLEVVEPASALALGLAIAARLLDRLFQPAEALAAIDAYEAKGGNMMDAVPVLGRVAAPSTTNDGLRREALVRLKRIHEGAGDLPSVVRVIEEELGIAPDAPARVVLHRQAAACLSAIGEKARSLAHAAQVMRLSPADTEARDLARGLSREIGEPVRYAEALVLAADQALADAEDDVDTPWVPLLLEAAGWSVEVLADPARAIELYARLADDERTGAAEQLLACKKLTELLEGAAARPRLLHYLERRAGLESDPEVTKVVLGSAARLADELGQTEQALDLWARRLTQDGRDLEALSARIDLLARTGAHAGLVQGLEARAAVSRDPAEVRADLVRAAEEYAQHLSDPESAILRYREVEKRFGRTDDTVDRLVALELAAAHPDRAAEVLEESIEVLRGAGDISGARLVAQLAELGDLQRLHLDQPTAAATSYATALELDASQAAAQTGLRELMALPELAHQAGEHLAAAFVRSGHLRELVDLLEARIAAAPNAAFRARILVEAASIEEGDGRGETALELVARAFALVPDAVTEERLMRLAHATGRYERAALGYQQAISACEDEALQKSLHLALGRIEEVHTRRLDLATAAYQAALEKAPTDVALATDVFRVGLRGGLYREAAASFVRVAEAIDRVDPTLVEAFRGCAAEAGAWDEVLMGVSDRVAAADLPAELGHDLKFQLAIWYRDAAADPDSAELVLRRAAADFPKESSLRVLADLQRRAPGKPLVDTLLLLSKVVGGDLPSLREAGEIASSRKLDHVQAILEHLLEVATERFTAAAAGGAGDASRDAQAACGWATDELVSLALAGDQAGRAVDLLESAAELPFPAADIVQYRQRAAEEAARGGLADRAVEIGTALLEEVPDHAPTIALMSSLHEAAGRLEDLLDLRGRELKLGPALERRLFLRLDQVRVMSILASPADDRLRVLAQNLADQPGHETSIEQSIALLLGLERFEEAVRTLEDQAAIVVRTDRRRASEMWVRAGLLAEEHLSDTARLEHAFRASVVASPSFAALDRLAALAHTAGERAQEVSWLEQLLGIVPVSPQSQDGSGDRRGVVARLGAALIAADEAASARGLLERELSLDPAAPEARRLLLDVYTSFDDWKELAGALEGGVQYAPDDATRIDYCRRAAFVERRHLARLDRAVQFLEMALGLAPTDRELKVLLADALLEFGGFERAREILGGLLEEFGRRRTKERASVHKLLARIARADGRLDEALAQAEEAAKIERMDPGILMLLAELARQRGELDRAEQAYRTLALVVGRRGPASEGEEPIAESVIFFQLQRIAEARGNEQQGRELLESALEAATRSADEALRLEECLREVGKVDLLQAAITEQLRSAEGATAAGLLITRSVIFEKNEELDQALTTRLMALRLQPTSARLIEQTRKLAERVGALPKLWQTLEELAEQNADKAEVAGELWYRLGKAAEVDEEWSRAADWLERSLASGYRSRRAFLALDAVLPELRDAARTRAALARFVDAPGADESTETLADALYRLAAFEFSSGRAAEGAAHLLRAIKLRADDARTLALLEPVMATGTGPSELVHTYLDATRAVGSERVQLAAHLLAAKESDADAPLLARGLELARALTDGRALRFFLSRRIEISEQTLSPGDARAELFERAELAETDGDFELAAKLIERLADLHAGEAELGLRLRLAALLSERLGRDEQAASLYELLLEEAPSERKIWQPLLVLYRRLGKEAAVEACIAKVEAEVESREDRELLRMERIRLMIGAGRLDEAERDLRETLDAEPDSAEAARVLVELLQKAGRLDELRELCTELFDQARQRADAPQVVSYGLELARLYAETPEEAASILLSGLNVASAHLDYLRTLHGLLRQVGSASDRADVLEYLARAESGTRAAEVVLELVSLRYETGDERGLGLALELGFELAPEDRRIGDRYVDHLRTQEDFGRLADILVDRAKRNQDAAEAVLALSEAAALYDQRLGDPGQAASAMLEAFARDGEDAGLLRRGVEYLVTAGQIDLALVRLDAAIGLNDEMTLGDLLDLRARILERERPSDLAALEQAAADLARALDQILPEDQEADIQRRRRSILQNLEDSYAASGDFDKMRTAALALASQAEESGNVDGAIQALLAYVERKPSDAPVALRLGALAQSTGDFSAAVAAFQSLFDASSGIERRQAALSLAAAATASGDAMQAKDQLQSILRDYPHDTQVLATLRQMYVASGAHRELAELLLTEAGVAVDPGARFALLVEAGDLLLLADDPAAACEVFEQARGLTREPYLIVTKLARAYIHQGEVERAQVALDEALEIHGKRRTPELALLQHGLALVADARGDVDGMFSWLETALMTDRANGEVASELAVRAQDSGRYDTAVRALQVIALGKGDAGMGKAEAYFRQAQIAVDQGDPKKALMLARRALTTDGGFSPAQQLVQQLS